MEIAMVEKPVQAGVGPAEARVKMLCDCDGMAKDSVCVIGSGMADAYVNWRGTAVYVEDEPADTLPDGWEGLPFNDLKEIAKVRNLRSVGISREALVELIRESIAG